MRRGLGIILAVVLLAGFAAAAADQPLIIGTTDRVTELSFENSWDMWTWHVLRATTGALVKLDETTLLPTGDLASSWEVSADGLVYTFHIRPGVTFWDGEKCDAAAVKWALDRTIRLNGPDGAVSALLIPVISKIEATGPMTVVITLNQPNVTFLLIMSSQVACSLIYSPKSTPENEFARGRYAGTGPYVLKQYVPDQQIVYEAFDKYYGTAPKSKNVIEKMYQDAATLRAAIEAGDIDVAFRTLSPQDIKDLETKPNVVITKWPPSPGIRYIAFNVIQPPVDVQQVREAIAYAVNRDVIVAQVFGGSVDPIYTMVPKVDPPFFGAIDVFPKRDIAIAKSLLAQVGYNASHKLKLNLWYTTKHYGTFEADVASVIKASLEETGVIEITLQALEWAAYIPKVGAGEMDMYMFGWHPDYLETSNYLAPWLTEGSESMGTYFTHHPNYQAYVDILQVATATLDETIRSKLYAAVQVLSATDIPFIPLWSMTDEVVLATRPGVKGAKLDITMDIAIWNIYK